MLKVLSVVFRAMIGVVALALALGLFVFLTATKPEAARRPEVTRAMVVRAMEVEPRDIAREFTGYGTARAMDAAEVAVEITARVLDRPATIEPGERVAEGDILLRLDPGDFEARAAALRRLIDATQAELGGLEVDESNLRAQVQSAEAEVEIAERDLERAREAQSRGAGTESQIDARLQALQAAQRAAAALRNQLELIPSRRASLEATLLSRQADLLVAERDLERATLRAPIAGVLQRVDAEEGEWVRAGDPVARIVDLRVIEVPLRLPVTAGAFVRPGDPVELRPDTEADRSWIGEVSRVAPEAEEQSRSIQVFVEVRQDPAGDTAVLRPGRFVMGRVRTKGAEPRMVVPRRAIDINRVLVGTPLDIEERVEARLAQFDSIIEQTRAVDEEEAERLAALSEAERREWVRRREPMRPAVVREVEVNVSRSINARFPDLIADEDQWSVLSVEGTTASRALRPGDRLILSNLDQLRPGMVVDLRLPGDPARAPIAPVADPTTASANGEEARP